MVTHEENVIGGNLLRAFLGVTLHGSLQKQSLYYSFFHLFHILLITGDVNAGTTAPRYPPAGSLLENLSSGAARWPGWTVGSGACRSSPVGRGSGGPDVIPCGRRRLAQGRKRRRPWRTTAQQCTASHPAVGRNTNDNI